MKIYGGKEKLCLTQEVFGLGTIKIWSCFKRIGSGFSISKRGTEAWKTISPLLSILLLVAFQWCGGVGQAWVGRREKSGSEQWQDET